MSHLSVFPESGGPALETLGEPAAIAERLKALGVQFEQWPTDRPLAADAGQDAVLEAFSEEVGGLNRQYGFESLDVVALRPDNPKKVEMREKFRDEHRHSDFEVRFFVDGRGVFYLHADDKVYAVLCEQGDLISVPAGMTHWFDMGAEPDFKCIRFFTTPDGWVGDFTGSDIARRIPDFDEYVAGLQ